MKTVSDNDLGRRFGVPKWLRRYSKRYGGGVTAVLQEHAKYRDTPLLDHARDRAAKRRGRR